MDHDLVRLADVLGHSSIETTRLYLVTTGTEHEKQMNRMGLLIWTKCVICVPYDRILRGNRFKK